MPLTILHAGVGAATAAAAYAADRAVNNEPVDTERLGHTALLGALYGAMPDILEPPTNRYHRKLFHSAATLAAAVLVLERIERREDFRSGVKAAARSAMLAYMTHLLLDSRTPMGLPLVF